jgi:hypothetical protein
MTLESTLNRHELNSSASSIRIFSLGELRSLSSPSYLIHKIIPEKGLVYLVAGPSSKKTFVAIHMACCIQTSTHFFGHPVKQGNAVYIAAEGLSGIQKRVEAWQNTQNIAVPEEYFSIIPSAINLADKSKQADLFSCLSRLEGSLGSLDFIVIDTLSRCLLGDENSPKDMSTFVDACSKLITRFECSILVVHHTAKSGTSGLRGHGSLEGAADLGLQIRNGKKDQFVLKLDAKPPKDDEPAEDIHLQADVVDLRSTLGIDAQGNPITSLALKSIGAGVPEPEATHRPIPAKTILSETIKSFLCKGPVERKTILMQIEAFDPKASSRAVDRALDSLFEAGLIYKPKRGVYALTKLGLDIRH